MTSLHAPMRLPKSLTTAAVALTLTLALAGCTSKQDAALKKAEQQANATGQPQQIVSTDKNGNTTTTTVQPLQRGQTTQAITTTVTPAPVVPPNTPATVPGAAASASAPGPTPDTTNAAVAGNAQNQAPPPGKPSAAAPVLLSDGTTAPAPAAGGPSPAYPAPNQAANQAPPQPYAQQAPNPAPPYQPAPVRIAAGTPLVIRINQHISVKHAHVGDRFTGEIEEPVFGPDRIVLIPRGAPVEGVVDAAHRRGHFKGRSILELRLVSLSLNGVRYRIDTDDLTRTKRGKGRRSAAFIGGGAGAGMLIGGIATGGVGLLVGGLAGGGGGALAGGLTGNRDIEIPAESIVRFRLADPLVLQPS
ncbi:MAG TPA: hypothetical protein VH250_02755 [Granulicella sp.]|jgi:hypothetical protein|nr:hypothetical protein [Granulicella sp.]